MFDGQLAYAAPSVYASRAIGKGGKTRKGPYREGHSFPHPTGTLESKRSHDKDSKEVTFTALTAEFELDDRIRTLFLKGPMESLQDFCFYFAEEKEIDAFVAADDTLTDQEQKIQTSRMRRAWAAVRQNELRNGNESTISSATELDDLVEEVTLREIKLQFWKRYRMKHPVEITPSDHLLSRCYRELG